MIDADNGEGCACVGTESICEVPHIPPSQFCYKPETTLKKKKKRLLKKRKLWHVTTQRNLDDNKLSETDDHKRINTVCFHLHRCQQQSNSETESTTVVTRVYKERRGWKLVLSGYRISFGKDKNVLDMDGGDGCTTIWIYLMPNYTLTHG